MQRSIHLAFAFVLVFLLYPFRSTSGSDHLKWHDYLFAAFAGYVGLYLYTELHPHHGGRRGLCTMDYIVGVSAPCSPSRPRGARGLAHRGHCRRFPSLCLLRGLFPGFPGPPGLLPCSASRPTCISRRRASSGSRLGVSATFIFLFVLFGAFREKTGIGQLFIDLSNAVAGWASGGPAKVAVVTSALEGMVSGSSVANTVDSGSFTIPMMKRLGYRPEFAAAVEASASTGGQIMPPDHGRRGLLMAEFINMPYIEIAKAAAIPACLYFFGIFIEVHFEAKRCKLRGMSRDETPALRRRDEGARASLSSAHRDHLVPHGRLSPPLCGPDGPCGLSSWRRMLRKSTRMSLRDILDGFEPGHAAPWVLPSPAPQPASSSAS